MFKNTAGQKVYFYAFDSTTNAPKTGDAANLTAYVIKDNGSLTVLADTSATELSNTNAKGYYSFDLSQTETNADQLVFTGKSATANIVLRATQESLQTTRSLADVLDETDVVETGISLRKYLRATGAFAGGKISGSTGQTFEALGNNGTTRITFSNPTNVTRTPTLNLT